MFFLFWVCWSVLGAAVLSKHNQAGTGFLLGFIFGPIGAIIAYSMSSDKTKEEAQKIAKAQLDSQNSQLIESRRTRYVTLHQCATRPCPKCQETVDIEATNCPHCGCSIWL